MSCISWLLPLSGRMFFLPAEPGGAFVVALAVSSKRFAVHDPPQRGHPSYPPQCQCVGPAGICPLVGAGLDQGTCTRLVNTHTLNADAHNGSQQCNSVMSGILHDEIFLKIRLSCDWFSFLSSETVKKKNTFPPLFWIIWIS